MTQPEKEQTVDDTKMEQVTDLAFEVCIAVSVLRCDELPLDEGDQEEALDILAAAVGDASDLTFTFVGLPFDPRKEGEPDESEKESEPDVEEVQAAVHMTLGERAAIADELESRSEEIAKAIQDELDEDDDVAVGTDELEAPVILASKKCKACHVLTTQLDVNQCPMCGNPFT